MPQAPWPEAFPGEFFVLSYDRDREVYLLVVDDEDGSSYNLGSGVPAIMQLMEQWGIKEVGYRAIDAAREFGMVQAIPSQDRVLRLTEINRNGLDTVANRLKAIEQERDGHVRHLPSI